MKQPVIVFDLGGVLIRICRTWQEACQHAGISVRADEAPEQTRARQALSDAYQRGDIGSTAFYAGISELHGGAYRVEDVQAVHRAWLLGEYPDIDRVLDLIHERRWRAGVLSNTNEEHWPTLLASAGLQRLAAEHGDHMLQASHRLRALKPDPSIFRAFEARTRVEPGQCFFFDDLPENVDAARQAGWQAAWIDPEGDPAAQMLRRLQGAFAAP